MLVEEKNEIEKHTCISHADYFKVYVFYDLNEALDYFKGSLVGLFELYDNGHEGLIESDDDVIERFKNSIQIIIGAEHDVKGSA